MASTGAARRYTIKQLADAASVSPRTLRYYDQIGLLVPKRTPGGYRIYGSAEVRRLQHILLLRTCGMSLGTIATVLDGDGCDLACALSDHLGALRRQSAQVERSIAVVESAIAGLKEFETMNDAEKFEQLKARSIEQFEEEYGDEARALYGDAAIDEANERFRQMSQADWDEKEALEQAVKDKLRLLLPAGDPACPGAAELACLHARWIKAHWGEDGYTPEAHVALAQGYLADPRFVAYYDDAAGEGATAFLAQVIAANIA